VGGIIIEKSAVAPPLPVDEGEACDETQVIGLGETVFDAAREFFRGWRSLSIGYGIHDRV